MSAETDPHAPEDRSGPALGSNPFETDGSTTEDPFLTALSAIEARRRAETELGWPGDASAEIPEAAESGRGQTLRNRAARPRRVRPIAPLAEIPIPEPEDAFDRWTSDDVRRRLRAIAALADPATGFDQHGLSLDAVRRAAPICEALYQNWFRVESTGHAHVPRDGAVVLVSNHAGLLPFDGAMIVTDLLMRLDPPRLARAVVDRFVGSMPWINVFMARMGQVIGTRSAVRDLLADSQPVLVFPEGSAGVMKPITQRYRLQTFHSGFAREALRAGAPIVPMAVIGSDDQSPILANLKPLGRLLGLPGFPITPTFPWLGPLGLLPYPVRYRIVYGEPVEPEGTCDDAGDVKRLADRVRRRVQGLINAHATTGTPPDTHTRTPPRAAAP